MIGNTTTPQAPPADIHEAQQPLINAAAILESLTRNPSDDDAELMVTIDVVLRELYAGMERCQQLDLDARKAQAAAAPDTHPDNAASVAAEAAAKFNRLSAEDRKAVLAAMTCLEKDDAPADTSAAPAPEQASTIEWPACWHVMEDAANHIGQLAAVAECMGGAFREDTGTPRKSGAAAAEEVSDQLRGVKRLLMDALEVELKGRRAEGAAPAKESGDCYPEEVIQSIMGFYRQLPIKQQSMVGQLIEDLLEQEQGAEA